MLSPQTIPCENPTPPERVMTIEERNALIEEHLPLVKYVAHRMATRLPAHVEVDDLINAGVFGLIDAIEKYDPSRNIKFKTYAEFRVRGAILDDLRSMDWAPRSTRQKASQFEKVFAELEHELGRHPSDSEVMERMGLDLEDYQSLLCEVRGVQLLSLDELRAENEEQGDHTLMEFLTDPDQVDPSEAMNLTQLYETVAAAIEKLPEKERLVVSLYYNDELTMKEIGQVLDITESRVSQLHTKAVLRLRTRLHKVAEEQA